MACTRYLTAIIWTAFAFASACGGGGLSPMDTGAADTGPGSTAVRPVDLGSAPCLLEYNDQPLILSNRWQTTPSECCYRQGGSNTCDLHAKCTEAAGAGCCLIYATDATAIGGGCCAYENGDESDLDSKNVAACYMLLTAGR